jgi:23S rRNA pseudouridine1911/1915/1917 synthase
VGVAQREAEGGWIVAEGEAGARLDKFLAAADRLGSRGRAAAAIERGKVLLNGADTGLADAARTLSPGDVVRVWMDRPGSGKAPPSSATRRRHQPQTAGGDDLRVVFEDAALIVVDKPAGLLAVPLDDGGGPDSMFDRLVRRWRSHGKRRPLIVHRIDRDTSGLVVFARDAQTLAALQAQFRHREPERIYLAVVHGRPEPATGVWRDYLRHDARACLEVRADPRDPDAHEAVCRYRVVEAFAAASLLEVRLETGRRNQIRAQAGLRGHALVGEERYLFDLDRSRAIAFPRQALHAHRLTIRHPSDNRLLALDAPLADDLRALISRLRSRRAPLETGALRRDD